MRAVAVVGEVLEQRLADALRHRAMRLAVQDERIDREPDIVDAGPADELTAPVSGSISTSQICVPEGKAPTETVWSPMPSSLPANPPAGRPRRRRLGDVEEMPTRRSVPLTAKNPLRVIRHRPD